jgi:hypothetical protein
MKKIKRLYLDIETSYNVVATFSLWPKYIPHDNILEEWYILCAAWKWEGQKRIHGAMCEGKCDKKVTAALREAILEADEIVYHNGKKFDYKKLNTRVLLNGLKPMSKPRECDTLLQCRKHFGFTSNRLDYIGKQLGVGGKIETSNALWLDVLKGSKKALREMFKYNKRDVELLEEVYHKLKSHIDVGYNANLNKIVGLGCPQCGGSQAIKFGFRVTKAGRYQKYQCQECYHMYRSGTREKNITPVDR